MLFILEDYSIMSGKLLCKFLLKKVWMILAFVLRKKYKIASYPEQNISN
jgi:hypothetical protein